MTAQLKLTKLEAAIHNLEQLAKEVELTPVGLTTESIDKLEWLRLSGRDFLAVTPSLQQAMVRYGKASVEQLIMSGRKYTTSQLLQPMADGGGKHFKLRFTSSGNDASFVPLKPSTLKSKARKGHPLDIGTDEGNLKKNFFQVTWKAQTK